MSFGDKPDWKRRALDAELDLRHLVKRLDECAMSTVAITPSEAERIVRDVRTGTPPFVISRAAHSHPQP